MLRWHWSPATTPTTTPATTPPPQQTAIEQDTFNSAVLPHADTKCLQPAAFVLPKADTKRLQPAAAAFPQADAAGLSLDDLDAAFLPRVHPSDLAAFARVAREVGEGFVARVGMRVSDGPARANDGLARTNDGLAKVSDGPARASDSPAEAPAGRRLWVSPSTWRGLCKGGILEESAHSRVQHQLRGRLFRQAVLEDLVPRMLTVDAFLAGVGEDRRPDRLSAKALVFCVAAPEDGADLETLLDHLALIPRLGLARLESTARVPPGDDRLHWMCSQVDAARVVLLLVTASFNACDECWDLAARAVRRQASSRRRVVPLWVRPADRQAPLLQGLQGLPRDGRPICGSSDPDTVWLAVAGEIRSLLEGAGS